ncbi:hypothetical protein [Streptomyces sp. NPDC060366]|uniref:hypothetical protein n=1 Tax=Streptomyces sp. NPDC060366 TaxID=3347105 RepID=UPI0036588EEF
MSTEFECRADTPCTHQAAEHGVYGCVDGCGCTWTPQRVAEPAPGSEPPFTTPEPTNPAAESPMAELIRLRREWPPGPTAEWTEQHAASGVQPDTRPGDGWRLDGDVPKRVHSARPVPDTELASLAVNAANALRDEKRQYEIACEENARLRAELNKMNGRFEWTAREAAESAQTVERLRADLEQARTATLDEAALARLLSDGDVHLHNGDYPKWDDLAESGEEQYRALARYILARCTVTDAGSGGQAEDGAPVAPTREQRECGTTTQHPAHLFLRMEVVFRCPGTANEDGAQQT